LNPSGVSEAAVGKDDENKIEGFPLSNMNTGRSTLADEPSAVLWLPLGMPYEWIRTIMAIGFKGTSFVRNIGRFAILKVSVRWKYEP
jgi:hypothetical protein